MRAIQHLETAKVLPRRVQALATTPGQGLHAWARQRAVVRRKSLSPSDTIANARQAKAEGRHRALIHEVSITTRRLDGSGKGRHHLKIAEV